MVQTAIKSFKIGYLKKADQIRFFVDVIITFIRFKPQNGTIKWGLHNSLAFKCFISQNTNICTLKFGGGHKIPV